MPPMADHPGIRLQKIRRKKAAKPGETRRGSAVLSREVLARRTGVGDYVVVSAEAIKAIESGARNPGDDTLAALYKSLEITAEEWPEGALAQTRYLVSRSLDEKIVGLETALKRRTALLELFAAHGAMPAAGGGAPEVPGETGRRLSGDVPSDQDRLQPDSDPESDAAEGDPK